MKKIIFLLISIVGIYLIYFTFNKTKINYLSISDNIMINDYNYNKYVYDYLNDKNKLNEFNPYFTNNTILLILDDIKNNRTIRINNYDYYLKKSLRESDFVVISVGMEELANNYDKYDMNENYSYFNKMYLNIKKLINEVKKYAQDKILFLGYYNPTNYYDSKTDEFFFNVDTKLNRLMLDNNIIYVELYEQVKGNNYKENKTTYLNHNGQKKIASIIEYYLE